MKFVYENKESYSQKELDSILEQHKGFVSKEFKGFVSPSDYESLKSELKPFKTELRNKHIKSLVKDLTTEDKLTDAIMLAGLTDEDTDEDITSKLTSTIESRKWLQNEVEDIAPEAISKTIKKEVVPKEEGSLLI